MLWSAAVAGGGESDETSQVSDFSATCTDYGCKYDTSGVFEAYDASIEYCDLQGQVKGKQFVIDNFLGSSLEDLSCHSQDYDLSFNDRYYKETPPYEEGMQQVHNEYHNDQGAFICHQYLKQVPCNGGSMIIDGIMLSIYR